MFSFTPTTISNPHTRQFYAIEEQVQKFEMTGYKADGATEPEIALEKYMIFKRGAWCMKEDYYSTDEGCDMFFGMLMQLGGDHLMPKRSYDLRDESEAAKKKAEDGGNENLGPTFRSDRRLVRLVIFRYFANIAWRKFQRFQALKKQQKVKRAFLSQKTWNRRKCANKKRSPPKSLQIPQMFPNKCNCSASIFEATCEWYIYIKYCTMSYFSYFCILSSLANGFFPFTTCTSLFCSLFLPCLFFLLFRAPSYCWLLPNHIFFSQRLKSAQRRTHLTSRHHQAARDYFSRRWSEARQRRLRRNYIVRRMLARKR